MENVLIRMPDTLEYFLAATAVVQDYWVQLHKQCMMQKRDMNYVFTVEIPDDGFAFFEPIFPRMEIVLRGEVKMERALWACVLDLTDVGLAHRVGDVTDKHVAEAWGVLVGAVPRLVPDFGPLRTLGEASIDVLLDEHVPDRETLRRYMANNFPEAIVSITELGDMRPANIYAKIAETKIFIGVRGGATYLASSMGRQVLELYPNDVSPRWLTKSAAVNYRMLYGSKFNVSEIWQVLEDMYCQITGKDAEMDLLGALQ